MKGKLLRLLKDSPSQAVELADTLEVDLGIPEVAKKILETEGDIDPFELLLRVSIELSNTNKSQMPTVKLMEMLNINPLTQKGTSGSNFVEGRYFDALFEKADLSGWLTQGGMLRKRLKVPKSNITVSALFIPPERPNITILTKEGHKNLENWQKDKVSYEAYNYLKSLGYNVFGNQTKKIKWTGVFKKDLTTYQKTLKDIEGHLEGLRERLQAT